MVQEFRPSVNAGLEGRGKMRKRRILVNIRLRYPRVLAAGLLVAAVAITMIAGAFRQTEESLPSQIASERNTSKEQSSQAVPTPSSTEEMRAVWVPFMSLDTAGEGEKVFREKFDKIISVAKEKA